MTTTATETPSDDALKTLLLVAIAGAFGGMLCWVLSAAAPDPTQTHNRFLWPFACLLGGAAAGAGGIFILADADRRHLSRCLVFAAFCGLMWRPVTEAVKDSVMATLAHKADQETVALAKAVSERDAEEVGNQLTQTGDETAKLVEALPAIDDPSMKKAVQADIETALRNMRTAAERGDPQKAKEGLDALTRVGVAAAANEGTADIAASTVDSVSAIATKLEADPAVVNSAYDSLTDVARAAKRAGRASLHFHAREARAETVTAAAETARAQNDLRAIESLPLSEAPNDLRSAARFHESMGGT